MMRRSLLSGFFLLIATASLGAPPVNPADAVAFMNQLWDRAVVLLPRPTRSSGWRDSVSCSAPISIVLGLHDLFSAVTGEIPTTRSIRNS